jgi:hypothetical protein
MKHSEQISRIKNKLNLAKKVDKDLKVFGASSHKYVIGKPITEGKIREFEKEYNVSLPSCYWSFLTEIGNGGKSYDNSAAGPFYGIYPFGKNIDELMESPKPYLSQPVNIFPNMSDEFWAELTKWVDDNNDELSGEEYDKIYDKEIGNIYSGILPIGSQGCSYIHALILNGDNLGKVVNLDIGRSKPIFTHENNFLDWYERWLDEIISGDLLVDTRFWFGFSMGGTDTELIEKYQASTNEDYKFQCLYGLLNKAKLTTATVQIINNECSNSNEDLSDLALELLTKADYQLAKDKLKEKYQSNPLIVFQYLYWYAKEASEEWIPEIRDLLSNKNIDIELFRFVCYVVTECKIDLTALIEPFTKHPDKKIKSQADYILGKLKRR